MSNKFFKGAFMRILGAYAYSNGIEFLVYKNKKLFVISGKRELDGKISIKFLKRFSKKRKVNYDMIIISAICAFIVTLWCNIIKYYYINNLTAMLLIGVFWIVNLTNLFFIHNQHFEESAYRYHSVGHMLFNYLKKYKKMPNSIEQIKKMNKFYILCSTMILLITLIFITMFLLIVMFVPSLILKVVCIVLSIMLILYLWISGKCNFIQKFYLSSPTNEEFEVVFEIIKELNKMTYKKSKLC